MHSIVARGQNNREKRLKGLETQGEHSRQLCKDKRPDSLRSDVFPVGPQCFLSATQTKPKSFKRKANRLETFGIR